MIINRKKDLKKLGRIYQVRIILYLLWLHSRRPGLPAPVHFSIIAALCMFALMPLVPLKPISIPLLIGGGISFALLSHEYSRGWNLILKGGK
jgi:hypothetical protein